MNNKSLLAIAVMAVTLIGGAVLASSAGNAFASHGILNSQATAQDAACGNGKFPFNPQCLNVDASSIGDGSAQAPVGLQEGGFAIRVVNVTINNNHTTPTPSVTPTTAILTVKVVIALGGGKLPSDFQIKVTGNHPNPATFLGSDTGTDVSLLPGQYIVSVTPLFDNSVSNYQPDFLGPDCSGIFGSGTIQQGEHKVCNIQMLPIGPPET